MQRRMLHCAGLAHKVHLQRQQRWRGSNSSILCHRYPVDEIAKDPCGSGFTREEGDTVYGTGYAGVRG